MAFVHAGGTVVKKELVNETLLVDTGCLVGFGTVYPQSLPFSRLAARIIKQIPKGAFAKGESSPLGRLGKMLMGD